MTVRRRTGMVVIALIGGALLVYGVIRFSGGQPSEPQIADDLASDPSGDTDDGVHDADGGATPFEDAEQAAIEAARSHPDIVFEPQHTSIAEMEPLHLPDAEVTAFDDHELVYVWSPLGHTENAPFGVSPSGETFKLPQELGGMARSVELTLAGELDALALMAFHLEFEAAVPGTDRVLLLESVHDIPEIDEAAAQRLGQTVTMPWVEGGTGPWDLELFTWRQVGGVLEQWKVAIAEDGSVQIDAREVIDQQLGSSVAVE